MARSQRLALGAVATAVAAGHLGTSHLAGMLALAVAALILAGATRSGGRARACWPIALGAALVVLRLALTAAPPAMLTEPPRGDGPWSFAVEAVGSPRDGQQTATLGSPPGAAPVVRVAATLPRYPVVVPGDRVTLTGTIRARPDSPYGEYLRRIGAVGTITARSCTIEPTPADPGRWLEDLRRAASEALARVLPEPEAGLAAGILIGLRDQVDRDLAAAFTTAGVSHVVAISGWNIAIVAAAVAAVAGGLGRRRRSVVTIVAIVAYVAFAGASPSVVRAALMAGVVLLARESGRTGRAGTALGWAVVVLLAIDPGLVGDAGFQLSSLATAGLIAWSTPLTDWFASLGRGRVPRWLAESLGVSLAAQAATLPIVLASFGRLAVLSPAINLVVVPLVAPAMAAGVVALAGGGLVLAGGPPIIGAVLAAPGWVILRILVAVVETGAGLPFASVTLEPPLDLVAAACAAVAIGVVTWSVRRRRHPARPGPTGPPVASPSSSTGRRVARPGDPSRARSVRRASALALVISLAVSGAVLAARPSGVARVSVLDVGQGDAILVEGSRGARLLIDGGPDPDRLLVALDRRIPPWDRRIDAVILSHPHEDHVAGLPLLLARYHVDRVFEPGMRGPGPGYAAWVQRLTGRDSPVRLSIAAGDRLAVDEISLRVLWPVRGEVPLDPPDGGTGINNVSVVLLGQVGARRFLLMGDVEQGIDKSLIAEGLPHVDFLKVAHHGSGTATTEPFVETVRPAVAVVSAGAGNPYGHPAPATLARLAAAGARVLRTDRDGTVVARFEPDEMSIQAEGGRTATVAVPIAIQAASTGTEPPRARTGPITAQSAPPAQSARSAEPALSARSARLAQSARSAEPAQSARSARLAQSARSAEPALSARSARLAQSARSAEPAQSAPPAQSARSAEPALSAPPAQSVGAGDGGTARAVAARFLCAIPVTALVPDAVPHPADPVAAADRVAAGAPVPPGPSADPWRAARRAPVRSVHRRDEVAGVGLDQAAAGLPRPDRSGRARPVRGRRAGRRWTDPASRRGAREPQGLTWVRVAAPGRRSSDMKAVASSAPSRHGVGSRGSWGQPTVGYHRGDDGSRPRGGRLPPALPRSPAVVRAPRVRRGRGRRLAGLEG